MRIAVISPHDTNNGTTTLAMLLGLEIAATGKKTCLTHAKPISEEFYKYLAFTGYQDKTSTSSQIVKILKEGGLTGEEVCDYCKQVSQNLEAFTNNATNFGQDEMDFMVKYIAKAFPHEHVVFDVDTNDFGHNNKIIQLCDVVVINITQSAHELSEFKAKGKEYLEALRGKPVVVVVNKYSSIKGTLKETAHWMGVKKPNDWVVLHENPWITWATNHGKLSDLFRKIENKDARVIELKSDLVKIVSTIMRAKVETDKKVRRR